MTSDKAFYCKGGQNYCMKETELFRKANHDPATKDAMDALHLIEFLEARNAELLALEKKEVSRSFGEKLADGIAAFGGSWTFIIIFLCTLFAWMALNIIGFFGQWDPFPFILLNLCLSSLAALQAPIILMSQNRQAQRDRLRTEIDLERDRLDLEVDTFAAKVTRDAMLELREMNERLKKIEKRLEKKRR